MLFFCIIKIKIEELTKKKYNEKNIMFVIVTNLHTVVLYELRIYEI